MRYLLLFFCVCGLLTPSQAQRMASPPQRNTPQNVGRQLGAIQVKQLNFRNADVTEVIEQIAIMAREADPPINIVLRDLTRPRAPLNLELRDKSLREILILVCKVAELDIDVRHGIVFISEPEN